MCGIVGILGDHEVGPLLVVYFFVCCGPDGGWKTAEELGKQGWYRIVHPNVES